VEARNVYGYSFESAVLSVTAAQTPDQPAAPTTAWDQPNDAVVVTWVEPHAGGTPITGYKVYLRQSDGATFT
jgi:hypothetical protein